MPPSSLARKLRGNRTGILDVGYTIVAVRGRIASLSGLRAMAASVALFLPLLVVVKLHDLPPPIGIEVQGRQEYVEVGTTFGQAIASFGLHATSGRLLDVEGKVLRYHVDPGRILLNGVPAVHSTGLAASERIEVVNGIDRTEGTRRVRTRVKGRKPGDPQFNLDTSRVVRITTVGAISSKVVSIVYRPIGKLARPPAVALTFDDGPWPVDTRKVLGVLERLHAKATFFVIGSLVERYPQIARAEAKAGMAIGNHSFTHPISPPFNQLTPNRIKQEMSLTNAALKKLGITAHVFRPPGGSYDAAIVETARRLGLRLVNWDVDPRDWESSATKHSIVANVLANVRPGSIVDLHDGGGDQSATIAALPAIVRGIRQMGLRLVVLGK